MTCTCSSERRPRLWKFSFRPVNSTRIPADADAQPEAAAAQHVEAGGLFRHQGGLPLRQDQHAGGKAQLGRACRPDSRAERTGRGTDRPPSRRGPSAPSRWPDCRPAHDPAPPGSRSPCASSCRRIVAHRDGIAADVGKGTSTPSCICFASVLFLVGVQDRLDLDRAARRSARCRPVPAAAARRRGSRAAPSRGSSPRSVPAAPGWSAASAPAPPAPIGTPAKRPCAADAGRNPPDRSCRSGNDSASGRTAARGRSRPGGSASNSGSGSTPALTPMVKTSDSTTFTAAEAALCTSLAIDPAPIGPI